jgi:signal transduction histidine kinase
MNSLVLQAWQRFAITFMLLCVCIECGGSTAKTPRDGSAFFNGVYHNSWTVREGLPSLLWQTAQTSDGFLWLATETGLYRFDGVEFKKIHTSMEVDSNSDEPATALLTSADGGLWIAYRSGGTSFVKNGVVTYYSPDPSLAQGIYALAQDRSNNVWGASRFGLMRFDGARWARVDESWGIRFRRVDHLKIDPEGTLWVDDGVAYYTLPRGGRRFRATNIRSGRVAFANDGTGWVAVDGAGLFRMKHWADGHWTEGQFLLKENISTVLPVVDGSLWIGAHDGVWRIDRSAARSTGQLSLATIPRFDKGNGLSDDYVYGLMQDREGSIWATTTKGLDQFRSSPIKRIDLPPRMGRLSLLDGGDCVLIGSGDPTKPTLGCIDENGMKPIVTPFTSIHQMYQDRQGALWLNADDKLWLYSGNRFSQISLPSKEPTLNRDIRAMTLDGSGTLWASVITGGVNDVYRYAHGRWSLFQGAPGFPKATVLSMLTDSHGQVWMGLERDRVAVVAENKARYYGRENGLQVGNITVMTEHRDHLWIGGTEGLDYFSDGRFQQILVEEGARLPGITGVVETEDGDLWLNCASGIAEIDASEIRASLHSMFYRVRVRMFNYLDGYSGAPVVRAYVSTAVQTQNGLIYFTSPKTVDWIDPHNISKNTVPPSTFITSVTVDEKVYENPSSLNIPKGAQNIQIDYTATSLLIPQRVQFRYKLEGFDQDWQKAGTRRQAFYSRLPPGSYSFRVLASNNDGVWSTSEGHMQFNVPPAFFQTWWFRSLCLIAVILLSIAVYLLRIRRLTAQIRSKFYERLAERERIARDLHDTFFQSIQGLLLRFNTGTAQLSPEEPARQIFMDALKQSDLVMSEGRELVLDLRATETNTTDLPAALAGTGEDFRLLSQAEYKVIVSGRTRPLHPVFSTELYRLAREAIYNAFRHANARSIEAELLYGDDVLKLSIRDDGIGIDEQVLQDGRRAGHLGITTMKERSQKIGGKLRIWSQRGNGTEIDVAVPASVAYLLPEQKNLGRRLSGWIRKIS